jgi:spermidine synthase
MYATIISLEMNSTARNFSNFLYLSSFLAAASAIAYELLLASYASFLMGATIFQYSLVLSLMMASMGLGALLTRAFRGKAALAFWSVETALAWIGCLAVPLLYYVFAKQWFTQGTMLFFVVIIGLGIGMEIPLLNELTEDREGLPHILFFDYLGGFAGGILFPLLFLPRLGFFRVAALLSVLNAVLALYFAWRFRAKLPWWKFLNATAILTVLFSVVYLFSAESIRRSMERGLFHIQ